MIKLLKEKFLKSTKSQAGWY